LVPHSAISAAGSNCDCPGRSLVFLRQSPKKHLASAQDGCSADSGIRVILLLVWACLPDPVLMDASSASLGLPAPVELSARWAPVEWKVCPDSQDRVFQALASLVGSSADQAQAES
jgi:hypothetical protein